MTNTTLKNFIDEFGFIGHMRDGSLEFGDSTQRTGTYYLCLRAEYKQSDVFSEIVGRVTRHTAENDSKKFKVQMVRHWDDRKWPGQLWCMSRDNFTPMLWAMAGYAALDINVASYFKMFVREIKERRFFLWNWRHIWPSLTDEPKLPDPISPAMIASAEIRAKPVADIALWEHVKLHVFEIGLLLRTLIRIVQSYKDPTDTSDDLNLINEYVFNSCVGLPTFTNWVCKKLYKYLRKNPFGGNPHGHVAKSVVRSYYSQPGDPPMWVVLDKAIEDYL